MDQSKIAICIEKALSEDSGISEKKCKEIAFHMTDWIDDLNSLVELYNNPDRYDSEDTTKILIDFLVHAPEHIAAASKLLTGSEIEDIFSVATTKE